MRVGTISQLEATTTEAVASPVEEARRFVQEQARAHLDETGWREGGQRAGLWGAATMGVTVFVVRLSRGGPVARDLLGEAFDGILVTDRLSASNWYSVRWRQRCWAHLLRDIEAMSARGGGSQEVGEALKNQAQQMLHWWHRVRDGTLSRSSFRSYMSPVRREEGSREHMWGAEDRRHVPGNPQAAPGVVDLRASSRCRTDEQYR